MHQQPLTFSMVVVMVVEVEKVVVFMVVVMLLRIGMQTSHVSRRFLVRH